MSDYGNYSRSRYYSPPPPQREESVSPPPRVRTREVVAERVLSAGVAAGAQYLFERPSVRRGVTQAERMVRHAYAAATEAQRSYEAAQRDGVSVPLGTGNARFSVDRESGAFNASYRDGRDSAHARIDPEGFRFGTSTRSARHRDVQIVEYRQAPQEYQLCYSNHRSHRRPRDGHSNFDVDLRAADNGNSFNTRTDERYGSRSQRREMAYEERDRVESLGVRQEGSDDGYAYYVRAAAARER